MKYLGMPPLRDKFRLTVNNFNFEFCEAPEI